MVSTEAATATKEFRFGMVYLPQAAARTQDLHHIKFVHEIPAPFTFVYLDHSHLQVDLEGPAPGPYTVTLRAKCEVFYDCWNQALDESS